MGVSCDRVVGFSLDISKEWDGISEVGQEKLYNAILDDLNYVGYSAGKDVRFKITILNDNMDGGYCKLVYVNNISKNGYENDVEDVIDGINELLATAEVPYSVIKHMKRAYKTFFNKELSKISGIKPEYILHWH